MIKAKGLILTRFASSLIFLFAFLIGFLFDLIMIDDLLFEIILITYISFFILIVLGITLEMKFFRDHKRDLISGSILVMISAEIYLMIFNMNMLFLKVIIILITVIGVLSWNQALSINKKKFFFFGVLSLLYYLIIFLMQFNLELPENYFFLRFIASNIVLISMTLILITEYIMKRKGYLKYI